MRATPETTEQDPRHFTRARAELRRYRALLLALDVAVEAEEALESLARQTTEADAVIAEKRAAAEKVDAEAAARRAKLDAETDRALAERRHEIERLDAVIAERTEVARAATVQADAAQARCRQWVEAESKLTPAAV